MPTADRFGRIVRADGSPLTEDDLRGDPGLDGDQAVLDVLQPGAGQTVTRALDGTLAATGPVPAGAPAYDGKVPQWVESEQTWVPAAPVSGPAGPPGPAGDSAAASGLRVGGGTPLTGRVFPPNSIFSIANGRMNSRLEQVARYSTFATRLVYPNFLEDNGDLQPNHFITVQASIEYPAGTFWPIYFQGSRTGTVEVGAIVTSDWGGPVIPAGATFWVRTYVVAGPSGFPMVATQPTLGGDGAEYNDQATNKVDGGTLPSGQTTGGIYAPASVLGRPVDRLPIVGIVGDSINQGGADSNTDVAGSRWGYLERAVATLPRVNVSRATEGFQDATAYQGRHRKRLLDGCTHIVCAYGTNDLGVGSLAALQGIAIPLWRELAATGAQVYQATCTPNVPAGSGGAATRTLWNRWLRDGAPMTPAGGPASTGSTASTTLRAGQDGHLLAGTLNPAAAVEDGVDTNVWVSGTTNDDVHPNATGMAAMAATIDLSIFELS